MPGEKSKSSGEYGEKIVAGLLDLIGWTNRKGGIDISCVLPSIHLGAANNSRRTHGVDYIVQYVDPLTAMQNTNILVSVKHREGYPPTASQRVSKFKEFLKEIAEASECFPSAKSEFPALAGTTSDHTDCVIIWINEAENALHSTIIPDLVNFRNTDKTNFDTVYLVDNRQAAFLHDSIMFAKGRDANFMFYYPDTGFNMDTIKRKHQGSVLPAEYINSPILLFKINSAEGSKLLLTTNQDYSKDGFGRILQLVRLITEGWASGIIVAYCDYHDYEHSSDIQSCLNELEDFQFRKQVSVVNLPRDDFRNMGGA